MTQAAEAPTTNIVRLHDYRPRKAPVFPELVQSPALALTMAVFAALSKAQRKRVGRELMNLSWHNGGSGVGAPNEAYELVSRMNAALDRPA